jgi:hypothetical protein
VLTYVQELGHLVKAVAQRLDSAGHLPVVGLSRSSSSVQRDCTRERFVVCELLTRAIRHRESVHSRHSPG